MSEELKEGRRGRREEGGRGGGCFLSPFLPAHIDSPRKKERRRISGRTAGHMTFSLWVPCFSSTPSDVLPPSLPSHSLPLSLSLPSPALQSFDMSSPTTKTEVGRLAGATAASGCLALKLPANTAGRGGGGGGGKRQREKDRRREGKEEGDRDRKTQKRDSKRSSEQGSVY